MKHASRLLPFLPLLLIAFVTQLDFPLQYDEIYHLHFSQYLAEHPTLDTIVTYKGAENYEAKGPFLFLVSAALIKIFGSSLFALRALVLGFSLLAVWLMTRFLRDLGKPYYANSVTAVPPFLILSITYMTDVPALSLGFVALFCLIRNLEENRPKELFLAIVAILAMLHIRVDFLFFLAAFVLNFGLQGKIRPAVWGAIVIPCLLRLPLLIAWGGLAAPPAQARPTPVVMALNPKALLFLLAVLGLYFSPLLSLKNKRTGWTVAALLFLAAFLGVPSIETNDPDVFGGTLKSLLRAVSSPGFLRTTLFAGLATLGGLTLFSVVEQMTKQATILRLFQIAFLISFFLQVIRGDVVYERYLLPTLLLGFLIVPAKSPKKRWIWLCWTLLLFIVQGVQMHRHQVF